jgi:hypothetical protein
VLVPVGTVLLVASGNMFVLVPDLLVLIRSVIKPWYTGTVSSSDARAELCSLMLPCC